MEFSKEIVELCEKEGYELPHAYRMPDFDEYYIDHGRIIECSVRLHKCVFIVRKKQPAVELPDADEWEECGREDAEEFCFATSFGNDKSSPWMEYKFFMEVPYLAYKYRRRKRKDESELSPEIQEAISELCDKPDIYRFPDGTLAMHEWAWKHKKTNNCFDLICTYETDDYEPIRGERVE